MKKDSKNTNEYKESKYQWGKIYRLRNTKLPRAIWFIGSSKFDKRGLKYKEDFNRKKDKDFYIKYWYFKKK